MRDYKNTGVQDKKKKKAKPATRKKNPAQEDRLQWIHFVVGYVLGAVTVGAVWVAMSDRHVAPSQREIGPAAETSTSNARIKPKVVFDYPDKLRQMEVEIPDEELGTGGNRAGESVDFVLQVASFRSLADADQLKARIALLGQQAYISKADTEGRVWHRVRVGPFPTLAALHKVRSELRRHDIQGIVLHQPKPE